MSEQLYQINGASLTHQSFAHEIKKSRRILKEFEDSDMTKKELLKTPLYQFWSLYLKQLEKVAK